VFHCLHPFGARSVGYSWEKRRRVEEEYKSIMKLSIVLTLLLFLVGCASSPLKVLKLNEEFRLKAVAVQDIEAALDSIEGIRKIKVETVSEGNREAYILTCEEMYVNDKKYVSSYDRLELTACKYNKILDVDKKL